MAKGYIDVSTLYVPQPVLVTVLEKKYTENHEWVELDSNQNDGTIGISNYAAKALGEVVYVELPQANTEVAAGDVIGSVESTKSASDIYSPVGGTITEANNALEEKPGTINKEPEGNGWIAKITVDAQSQGEQLDNLMDAKKYEKFTEEAGDEH
ncbi:MAG: glycine cleavage system H-protein subunit [Alyxoria varia]|nr:MAG: glycine cleavage system H-protein subunit [Alyxoria varia]